MIKRLFVIVVLVFVLIGGIYFHTNKGADTVTEAIEQSGRHVDIMVHQEQVQNGVIVFFKSDVGDRYSLDSGFVKKGLNGWTWVWGGGFAGFSGQYFPGAPGTPFPMIFGVVENPEIAQVEVNDQVHKDTQVAQIVGTDTDRIWFVILDKSDGPDFEIVSLSSQGDVLDSKSINTTNISF